MWVSVSVGPDSSVHFPRLLTSQTLTGHFPFVYPSLKKASLRLESGSCSHGLLLIDALSSNPDYTSRNARRSTDLSRSLSYMLSKRRVSQHLCAWDGLIPDWALRGSRDGVGVPIPRLVDICVLSRSGGRDRMCHDKIHIGKGGSRGGCSKGIDNESRLGWGLFQ